MIRVRYQQHDSIHAPVQAARYSASRQVADLAAVFDQLKLHKVKLIGLPVTQAVNHHHSFAGKHAA
jgi:2-succinyl-6-hydroxy-2,4-cyclohexadiene-1-carboxylate synthase